MLKRQRQPSPPPSSWSAGSSIPFVSNGPSGLGDLAGRDADMQLVQERVTKKRRTAPPSLDGATRGWAHPVSHSDEEEWDEDGDDAEGLDHGGSSTINSPNSTSTTADSPYTTANTMLRDLHTLHQHRLLFAAPSPGSASPLMPHHHSQAQAPATSPSHPQWAQHPAAHHPQLHHLGVREGDSELMPSISSMAIATPLKGTISLATPPLPHSQTYSRLRSLSPQKSFGPPMGMGTGVGLGISLGPDVGMEAEAEAGVVSENYENTNKLLGSLFLSRRRVLDLGGDQTRRVTPGSGL